MYVCIYIYMCVCVLSFRFKFDTLNCIKVYGIHH